MFSSCYYKIVLESILHDILALLCHDIFVFRLSSSSCHSVLMIIYDENQV